MTGSRRGWTVGGAALVAVAVLAVLRPWTILPIQTAAPAVFDATAYVESLWPEVVEEAETRAVNVDAVLVSLRASTEGSARASLFVKGEGVVTDVDLASRVGVAVVRLDGAAAPATLRLFVGPVLRGTALRDASSFVQFSDFANQTEFAGVANALNDRVLAEVLASVLVESLVGRTVAFVGATTVDRGRPDAPLEVVPLRFDVDGADR